MHEFALDALELQDCILDALAPLAYRLRKLRDDQLTSFDRDYFTDEMWDVLCARITAQFPDGCFSFLDVGGGNGQFTDGLLDRFPGSRAVLIDNAEVLIARNRPHPRKTLILESCERLEQRLGHSRFDFINFNFLLHHLVVESYIGTRREQVSVLQAAARLLSPGGRVSVFETLYDGMFMDGAPGWLIHRLTTSKLLAPLTRRMGANTAGCGVGFQSEAQWRLAFRSAGFRVAGVQRYERPCLDFVRRVLLHIGARSVGHFWLAVLPDVTVRPPDRRPGRRRLP